MHAGNGRRTSPGPLPTIDHLTISIAKIRLMCVAMTPEVRNPLPLVLQTARFLVCDPVLADALAGIPAA